MLANWQVDLVQSGAPDSSKWAESDSPAARQSLNYPAEEIIKLTIQKYSALGSDNSKSTVYGTKYYGAP